jgi:hypothetical protein
VVERRKTKEERKKQGERGNAVWRREERKIEFFT